MAAPCLLDNDVVIKAAAYGLGEPIVGCLTIAEEAPAVLGVAHYVVLRKSKNAKRFSNPEKVSFSVAALLDCLSYIEPSEEEIELAAELEDAARDKGGSLDVGEAQLLAILLKRSSQALVTGDKRAIEATARLELEDAAGRLICLEQIIASFIAKGSAEMLRKKVCMEPQADRTLSNCFACSSFDETSVTDHEVMEAIQSYLNHLSRASGDLLMSSEKLAALTA